MTQTPLVSLVMDVRLQPDGSARCVYEVQGTPGSLGLPAAYATTQQLAQLRLAALSHLLASSKPVVGEAAHAQGVRVRLPEALDTLRELRTPQSDLHAYSQPFDTLLAELQWEDLDALAQEQLWTRTQKLVPKRSFALQPVYACVRLPGLPPVQVSRHAAQERLPSRFNVSGAYAGVRLLQKLAPEARRIDLPDNVQEHKLQKYAGQQALTFRHDCGVHFVVVGQVLVTVYHRFSS